MLNLTFDEFYGLCADAGYEGKKQSDVLYFIRTSNNVKHEIKYIKRYGQIYVVGFGRSLEEVDKLREEISKRGFNIVNDSKKALFVEYKNFDTFIELAKIIEDIDDIMGRAVSRGKKVFDNRYSPKIIAKRYFSAIENEDQDLLDLSRDMLSADKYDADISYNDKTPINNYREHLVPCIAIHNKIISMIMEEEASLEEVAHFIHSHLAILHIPEEDAKILDGVLGLQTCMPEGWEWGGDIFARIKELKKFKIK